MGINMIYTDVLLNFLFSTKTYIVLELFINVYMYTLKLWRIFLLYIFPF